MYRESLIRPSRLKMGDEIRVIAPSTNMSIIAKDQLALSKHRMERFGLKVTFGKNVYHEDYLTSASVEDRIEDLHQAFLDKHVKGIFAIIGGFNVNGLLAEIDYELIKNNPKVICGYSDITALNNAIFHKTGLMTYQGPAFSTFGMEKGIEYTTKWFKNVLIDGGKFSYDVSDEWSDDLWFLDQVNRNFMKNEGYWIINEGRGSGTVVGGNLSTFNLLLGTQFMPVLYDSILMVEEDESCNPQTFERMLQALIHQPDFEGVNAIVIGRFQKQSKMTRALLTKIIKSKKPLINLPVIANVDFGHTSPRFTYPIGGHGVVDTSDKIKLIIE